LAYNWALVGHFLLTGLATLLLLRHFGFPDWQCILLAITYQFSSALVIQFGQVWVHATLAYYPLLWLAWDKWFLERKWHWVGVAGIIIAAIFYSGSLQTDSYLAFFMVAILLGYGIRGADVWRKFSGILLSGVIGFCLGAPVLLSQIELFALSVRKVDTPFNSLHFLGGMASLSALYPWLLGTFRTLDLSKLAGQMYHFGFALFIGSAAVCLALLGTRSSGESTHRLRRQKRTAIWLLVFYFLIASSPLANILYLRIGGLAALALVVLAAIAVTAAIENTKLYITVGRWILVFSIAGAIVSNIFAFVVYPKFLPAVKAKVLLAATKHFAEAPALRSFQVDNLPAEISFRNPETVLATAGLVFLAFLLIKPRLRSSNVLWMTLLVLNLGPVMLFARRFIPHDPIELWHRLLSGGEEQRKVAGLRDTPYRLHDIAPTPTDQLFPWAMSHLYGVRTVHGYGALPLATLSEMSPQQREKHKAQFADVFYWTETSGSSVGVLSTNDISTLVRFHWLGGSPRKLQISEAHLNTIKLDLAPGGADTLQWADTFFPGWKAFANGQEIDLKRYPPCFTSLHIPASTQEVLLRYKPRFLDTGKRLGILGLVIAGGTLVYEPAKRHRNAQP
jgi:hypothetical protein